MKSKTNRKVRFAIGSLLLLMSGTIQTDAPSLPYAIVKAVQSKNNHAHRWVDATFENDFIDFALLSSNPEVTAKIVEFLEYIIDLADRGYEIPLNERKIIPLDPSKPFHFNVVLSRYKLSRILTYLKASVKNTQDASLAEHIKNSLYKLLDLLSYRIVYECALEEHDHNDVQYLSKFVYGHRTLTPVLENPNPQNLFNLVKQSRIGWDGSFGVRITLPQLKKG